MPSKRRVGSCCTGSVWLRYRAPILLPPIYGASCVISCLQGLACELSVAAALGHLPFHLLPPLFRLLHTYNLPSEPPPHLPLAAATAALFKDKKNASASPDSAACVSVVLMADIGCPVARKSLPVPAWLVSSAMACSISITPPCRPIIAELRAPGSKSISNRALLLAALCPHPVLLRGMLHCDDTHVMIEGRPLLLPPVWLIKMRQADAR